MSRTLTAALVATAALSVTALPATPLAASAAEPEAGPGGPISAPVTARIAGHTLRGVAAPQPAGLAAAATGSTGSIVFIKGGNVWLTRPDGSGQRQVTKDGTTDKPYSHPTMSDAGVIAVMKGSQIVRMAQSGAVLNRMTPPDLFIPDYATVLISPIVDPEISPDGTKIAYSQLRLEHYGGGDYNYNVTEAETAVTSAKQFTQPTKVQLGSEPAWIGNNRLTLDRSGDVHLADLGQDAKPWFVSDDIFGPGDILDPFIALNEPEVSPNRQRVLFGVQNTGFGMTTTTSDPAIGSPGKPTANPQCFLTPDSPGAPFAQDATFGPDSDSAVYSEGGKLSVIRNLAACGETTTMQVIATGATEPDWSPAPLSAPPAPGTPGSGSSAGGAHAFRLIASPVITGKAKVGKRLRASAGRWSPAPASYSFTWLRNGKVVKGRTGSTYTVSKGDRGKRIQVRVTVRRTGYAARTAVSTPVTVKRR